MEQKFVSIESVKAESQLRIAHALEKIAAALERIIAKPAPPFTVRTNEEILAALKK